ncbi:MAG: hypothetical protein CI949_774 [Halanaerobium sp.]|nr:MAG: hypothetical protein CI949_774 [Halanaerobium sp.]
MKSVYKPVVVLIFFIYSAEVIFLVLSLKKLIANKILLN